MIHYSKCKVVNNTYFSPHGMVQFVCDGFIQSFARVKCKIYVISKPYQFNLNAQKLTWLPLLNYLSAANTVAEYHDWRWKCSNFFLTNRIDDGTTCMNLYSLEGKAPCSCIIKNPRKAQMRNLVVTRFCERLVIPDKFCVRRRTLETARSLQELLW